MSGPRVRTPLDVVGVRFRVPARKRRLQAVMRGRHTPCDTKGFRGSWLHACKPCPFRSRRVSVVCGEWPIPAVTFEGKNTTHRATTHSLLLPLTPARNAISPIRQQIRMKSGSRRNSVNSIPLRETASILCADTSEVRTSYLRTPLDCRLSST
jgi:hypothetical protein